MGTSGKLPDIVQSFVVKPRDGSPRWLARRGPRGLRLPNISLLLCSKCHTCNSLRIFWYASQRQESIVFNVFWMNEGFDGCLTFMTVEVWPMRRHFWFLYTSNAHHTPKDAGMLLEWHIECPSDWGSIWGSITPNWPLSKNKCVDEHGVSVFS